MKSRRDFYQVGGNIMVNRIDEIKLSFGAISMAVNSHNQFRLYCKPEYTAEHGFDDREQFTIQTLPVQDKKRYVILTPIDRDSRNNHKRHGIYTFQKEE